jgi:hypothetical protein
MDKVENKNSSMTVVHLAIDANKPMAPFIGYEIKTKKVLDPSSTLRAERYPIPGSFEYRSTPQERDYA